MPADVPEPENVQRTKPGANANVGASQGTYSERFPSYIRRENTGAASEDGEGGERETEKGYVGGDRVRLLVGR